VTEMRPTSAPSPELRMRVASGAVLIALVVLALVGGALIFSVLIAACAIAALHEWHRLVNGRRAALETVPAAITIIAVVAFSNWQPALWWPLAAIAIGAGLTALLAAVRGNWVLWHGVGVLYIGAAVLALMVLRDGTGRDALIDGRIVVGAVFAAVWAADTGALFVGRCLGGPRLAPQLSPKKTWAGFLGGVALAGLAELIYVVVVGGAAGFGAVFGIFLGVAANCGDLFESWVKRVFQTKNSGNLIPGHGGMLDRVDSLLLAAPAAAAFLLVLGVDALFGADL
jgi:phosphatidate cytidylyltransferase